MHQEDVAMVITVAHKIPGDVADYFPKKKGKTLIFDEMKVTLK